MTTIESEYEQGHIPSNDYRTYVVVDNLSYLGIGIHFTLIFLFWWLGYDTLAVFNIFSTVVWITAKQTNKQGKHKLAFVLLITEIVLHCVLAVYYLGWQGGFQYYLIPTIPLVLFNNTFNTKLTVLMAFVLTLLFTLIYAFTFGEVYQYSSPGIIEILNYINIFSALFALVVISYYFRLASMLSEQQLELLAKSDYLTGLFNRRGALEFLNKQHQLRKRQHGVFSIVMADIDYFKKLNDKYGHQCGDEVLYEVAHVLKRGLRETDMVARWGGEEFLIVLLDTTESAAEGTCENLRRDIERHTFHYKGQSFSVRLTFGVAEHLPENNIDSTIDNADAALYKGKNEGRNRVCLWTDLKVS